ncbi:hypothetical protein FQN60_011581, partial [Etheostoma spectabile]
METTLSSLITRIDEEKLEAAEKKGGVDPAASKKKVKLLWGKVDGMENGYVFTYPEGSTSWPLPSHPLSTQTDRQLWQGAPDSEPIPRPGMSRQTAIGSSACQWLMMMWSVVLLLAAALPVGESLKALCLSAPLDTWHQMGSRFNVESYNVVDLNERLAHGRQLKIYLPKGVETLDFIPAFEPGKTFRYLEKGRVSTSKGRVSGTGTDRRWYIDKVTYEDQGTYIQKDYWNKEISTVRVAVTTRHNYVKCIAGESLDISLEGIDLADAVLSFSGEAANVTLVRDGAPVSQDLPDYWDRVKTHSMNIEIRNVNTSDVGRYTLRDRRNRVVSITRMDLTDHHEHTGGNPLMALLLLLGIPAGICCCCRKKIFTKKSGTSGTLQATLNTVQPPPSGPVGPCPPYSGPGTPGV